MTSTAIEIKKVAKTYRLGEFNIKTLTESIKNIFSKNNNEIYSSNDRTIAATKETHVWALKNIDLNIKKGEVVGIIGKNGAGKSTLLKLLSRITTPSHGEIVLNGRVGALLEVGTGFQPDLTGRENVYLNGAILGMTKKEIDSKMEDIIAFSGCAKYIDTPVKRYSSGMNVRLGFSVAAHLEPEILIIDEVLAVGDQDFQDQCVKKMKEFARAGKTVLFVSHNMASVKGLCERGIVLEKGEIGFDGAIDDAIQFYLEKQEKASADGIIGKNKGEIRNQEVFFNSFQFTGEIKKIANHLLYKEALQFNFDVQSAKDKEVNIEFLIHSSDNYRIGAACNAFEKAPLALKIGSNAFSCIVENNLNPGNYNLSLAIAETNGTTLHYLPNFIDFKVDFIPLNAADPYPFVWVNGAIQFKSKWVVLP